MNKKVFTATIATLIMTSAKADTVGLYIGGQIWQTEISGQFGEQNNQPHYHLKKERQASFFIAVEHPLPLLPNIRIAKTSLDTSGTTSLTRQYSADTDTAHVDVQVDSTIKASFNVNYIDYTLYYEVLDNGLFSFDLGLTARDFGGGVTNTDTSETVTTTRDFIWDGPDHIDHDYHNIVETTNSVNTKKIKTNDVEFMLFAATNAQLPLTDLSVFAQGDFLLTSDHSMYDYQAGFNYDLMDHSVVDVNLTLGYKSVKIKWNDFNSLYSDLEFKGAFVGVIAHF